MLVNTNSKRAGVTPSKTKPAPSAGMQLQLPNPNESLRIMLPGLKAMDEKEALDYLFGLDPYPPASKSGKPNNRVKDGKP